MSVRHREEIELLFCVWGFTEPGELSVKNTFWVCRAIYLVLHTKETISDATLALRIVFT